MARKVPRRYDWSWSGQHGQTVSEVRRLRPCPRTADASPTFDLAFSLDRPPVLAQDQTQPCVAAASFVPQSSQTPKGLDPLKLLALRATGRTRLLELDDTVLEFIDRCSTSKARAQDPRHLAKIASVPAHERLGLGHRFVAFSNSAEVVETDRDLAIIQSLAVPECPVDRRAPDAELARNRAGSQTCSAKALDGSVVHRRSAPTIDPARFGERDTIELSLAAQIGFEFGEDAEHIEKRLTGGTARVDRLLSCLQRHSAGLQLMDDVLQVFDAARQPIDPSDDERVARTQETEQGLKLRSASPVRSAFRFSSDYVTTRHPQRLLLDGEILVERGDTRVAVKRHFLPICG